MMVFVKQAENGVALDGFTWDGASACTPPD